MSLINSPAKQASYKVAAAFRAKLELRMKMTTELKWPLFVGPLHELTCHSHNLPRVYGRLVVGTIDSSPSYNDTSVSTWGFSHPSSLYRQSVVWFYIPCMELI